MARRLVVDCLVADGRETTCISPLFFVRHPPTVMRRIPLLPVGNSAACQANNRPRVIGALCLRVASSIDFHNALHPAVNRRQSTNVNAHPPGMEERTCPVSSFSPSISLVLTTSCVSICSVASSRNWKPRASMRPSRRPCEWRVFSQHGGQLRLFPMKIRPFLTLVDITYILRTI